MSEQRQYVPHAVTGKPVPVLTPEEQTRERENMRNNAQVGCTAYRCWCGDTGRFRGTSWLAAGDQVEIVCKRGHHFLLRFIPETLG